MPPRPLTRLRKLCLGLPESHEVEAWGEPTFRLNNHLFAMYAGPGNHHGAGHEAGWVKCTAMNQSLMIGANPKRFFSPPYVGPSGWIGVRLDTRVNWKELTGILRDGYDLTATMKGKRRAKARTKKRAKPRSK